MSDDPPEQRSLPDESDPESRLDRIEAPDDAPPAEPDRITSDEAQYLLRDSEAATAAKRQAEGLFRRAIRSKLFLAAYAASVLGLFLASVSSFAPGQQDGRFTNRGDLHKKILTRVHEGAPLDVVTTVFDRRKTNSPVFYFPRTSRANRYVEPIKLSEVLADIKSELYDPKSSSIPEPISEAERQRLITRIDELAAQERESDPLGALADEDRKTFRLLREKLSDDYEAVREEIEDIVYMVVSRDAEIARHLDKSDLTFLIAIAGVLLAIPGFLTALPRLRRAWESFREPSSPQ